MDNPDVPIGQTNDLATLGNLDEKILLGELKYRYNHDKIYTYVGDILVAINPFRDLGICGQKHAEMYKNKIRVDNPPHIFAVSDAAYQSMLTGSAVSGKKNQCVVISGESGAGKTESTKFIIKQVIELCKGKSQLEQQILQVNPLLEAFGNAQTTMNDNSSRFGKYIQLKFKDGKVMGAKISEYLLEKSRVVFQNKGEENFHIFYYMLAGLTPEQQKKYKMQAADKYNYLTNGPSSAKTKQTKMKDMLAELSNAMDLVGFLDEEQDEMYSVLAATLMMGQIQLDANEDDAAFIKGSDQAVSAVAELIGINDEELKQVLTFNLSSARGDVFQRNYTKHQALDARDAMTKTLYGRLFSWIVNKVNQLLAPELSLHVSDTTEIGILDIFGFEQFQTNSFEQMCINLANEQLQYFFNQHIFLLEQEEYKNEGIDWTYVPFVNNQSLLDLFLAKPIGVLGLLDEECLFPKATDHTFVEKLNQNFARNHHFIKAKNATSNNFSIDHYAGRVEYTANLFLEKNRDTLPSKVMQMLRTSTNDLVSQIFRGTVTRTGTLALQSRRRRTRKSARPKLGTRATVKKMTVGAQFKNSLSVLMELLNLSNPHFVRCIKPNTSKAAKLFEDKFVTAQLRYTGMLETTRIRRLGYALRPQFADFVRRYKVLARSAKLSEDKHGCVKILKTVGLTDWHVGKTKLFLKYYHQDQLEEHMQKLGRSAMHIQKIVRGFLARCRYKARVKKAQQQKDEMNAFLLQLAKMSLDQQHKLSKVMQGDKKIPKSFFESIRRGDKVIKIEAPAVQIRQDANQKGDKESSEEEGDDDDEDDEIIEDEFVRIKQNLFGKEGTRQASVHWFKATQSMAARDKMGTFATWFHGIITRRRAEDLLADEPIGSFLIRVSESRFGYSLSLKSEGRCKHFMIDLTPTGKYIVVGEMPVFKDLQGLVKFYQMKPISAFGDVLKQPCGQAENELDYAELLADRKDKRGSGVPSSLIKKMKDKGMEDNEEGFYSPDGYSLGSPQDSRQGKPPRPVSEASYLYVDPSNGNEQIMCDGIRVGGPQISKMSRNSARRSAVRENKSGIRRGSMDK
ncbi:myosin-IIIb-like isoform X2 [Patiria miniata]|uniref:non-specific serine/threonine protein kinase n=1 Tax=Patiria miniata TaxID=46514 RepID=A0A914BKS6_PATMI|nr:myosin-IIIb-like isoform X2 [Patiria miniata]